MPIEPGCYVLKNQSTGSLLGVKDGEWNDAEVDVWHVFLCQSNLPYLREKANELMTRTRPAGHPNTDLNDLIYNRFLIYENPGHEGTFNLLNLRAGAFLVHHDKVNCFSLDVTVGLLC